MLYDVVIIGSGLAGLNSALHAAKYGRVLVITKSRLMESNSSLAQGGIASVFLPHDNFQKHIKDTLVAGVHHNNKKSVKYFVEQSPSIIKKLQKLGVHFATNKKTQFALHREAGHQFERIVHVGDHTGLSIMQTLVKKISAKKNITVWENNFAKDLIVKEKTCYGVLAIHQGKFVPVYARRTILATGGAGQLFEYTTNPAVTTGDGIALATRAGCKIKDMEFIQFHPTAFSPHQKKSPKKNFSKNSAVVPLFLLSETIRGEGARLLNAKGEKFMQKYHKDAELAPRDIVSRAMFEEQKHGPIYLDVRHKSETELRKKFPTIYNYIKKNGYNLSKDLIPATPAAHYLCGGIATDIYGKTNIKNLYAIGEVACTGLHGANRLASNSLLEAAVMSEHVMDTPLPESKKFQQTIPKNSEKPLQKTDITMFSKIESQKLLGLKLKLQKLMWQNVGIVRSKKSLENAKKQIKKIRDQIVSIPSSFQKSLSGNNIQKFELENMLQTSELMIKAALKRKKSLGAHYRKD